MILFQSEQGGSQCHQQDNFKLIPSTEANDQPDGGLLFCLKKHPAGTMVLHKINDSHHGVPGWRGKSCGNSSMNREVILVGSVEPAEIACANE